MGPKNRKYWKKRGIKRRGKSNQKEKGKRKNSVLISGILKGKIKGQCLVWLWKKYEQRVKI